MGGRPKPGGKPDKRLAENKGKKAAPKKASGFVPFGKGGKKPKSR